MNCRRRRLHRSGVLLCSGETPTGNAAGGLYPGHSDGDGAPRNPRIRAYTLWPVPTGAADREPGRPLSQRPIGRDRRFRRHFHRAHAVGRHSDPGGHHHDRGRADGRSLQHPSAGARGLDCRRSASNHRPHSARCPQEFRVAQPGQSAQTTSANVARAAPARHRHPRDPDRTRHGEVRRRVGAIMARPAPATDWHHGNVRLDRAGLRGAAVDAEGQHHRLHANAGRSQFQR